MILTKQHRQILDAALTMAEASGMLEAVAEQFKGELVESSIREMIARLDQGSKALGESVMVTADGH